MKKTFTILIAAIAAILMMAQPMKVWADDVNIAIGINPTTSSSTSYLETEQEFTIDGVTFKMNNYNPSTGQIRGNKGNATSISTQNFSLYNTTPIPGTLKSITITVTAGSVVSNYTYLNTGTTQTTATTDGANPNNASWSNLSGTYFAIGMAKGGTSGTTKMSGITITYTTGSGGDIYTVSYDGNNATSGNAPTDATQYSASSSTVNVLGNVGNPILQRDHYSWGGWCLNENGTGTVYGPGEGQTHTYTISANTTFYAKWNPNTHTVTMPTSDTYGDYTMDVTNPVGYGTTVTLTYEPASGYDAYSAIWSVNNTPITGNSFTMPDENVTVTVELIQVISNQFVFNTDEGLSALGIDKPNSGAGTNLEEDHNYISGNVTMTVTHGTTETRVWNSNGNTDLRVYSTTGSLTFSVPSGSLIRSVSFTGSAAFSDWNGTPAQSVTFTASSGIKINTVTVSYTSTGVLPPTFTPAGNTYNTNQSVTISCTTAGASIYYTTDGTTPSASSTPYAGAITVDHNMTLKAVAIKGGDSSSSEATYELTPLAPTFSPAGGAYDGAQHVTIACETTGVTLYYKLGNGEWTAYNNPVEVAATTTLYAKATKNNWTDKESSASYTITPILSNIAALTANTEGDEYLVTLNDAVVTYVNGSYAYIQDASGAVLLYKSKHGYTAGDVLNGTATVTYQLRYGNPQITAISGVTKTSGTAPSPTSVAQSAWNYTFSDVLARYFQITGATITKTTSNDKDYYWVSLNSQSVQLYAAVSGVLNDLNVTKKYTITGFPTLYVKDENTTLELNVFVAPVEEPDAEAPNWETLPTPIIFVGNSYDITLTNYVTGYPTPTITLTSTSDDNDNPISNSLYEYEDGLLMFQPTTAGTYNFTFNASNTEGNSSATLTITATTPSSGSWVLTSLSSLTSSDVFVIVGTDDDVDVNYYALPNNGGTSNPIATSININNGLLSNEPADNLQWTLIGDATNGYTFYPKGSSTTWLYCSTTNDSGSNTNIKVGNGNRKVFTLDNNEYMITKDNYVIRYLSIYYNTGVAQDWRGYTSTSGGSGDNINAALPISFYKLVSDDITHTTTVSGCGDAVGNYHLIASPVASVTPTTDNGFIRTDGYYDLYYFNQTEENEWRNYKQNAFNLVSGKGYLYANKNQTTLTFTGKPYNGNGVVALSYDGDAEFAGWNLIGNPYATEATVNSSYYKMNTGGTELEAETSGTAVAAMHGIFVKATAAGQSVTFSTGAKRSNDSKVVLNVIGNDGNVIDRTIVCFNEGGALPKFMLDESNTKIYIPQTDADYAIVSSNGHNTMPVNFEAKEMGMYTISVEVEGVEMSKLRLTDRLTGEVIDLLRNNKYSFIASNSDIKSRFILSFTEKGYNANGNETFAFQNGNDIIVNGEGELQIFDVMGRNIMNTTINGVQTVNVKSQGVYIFKLNENIQKIVVR